MAACFVNLLLFNRHDLPLWLQQGAVNQLSTDRQSRMQQKKPDLSVTLSIAHNNQAQATAVMHARLAPWSGDRCSLATRSTYWYLLTSSRARWYLLRFLASVNVVYAHRPPKARAKAPATRPTFCHCASVLKLPRVR